MHKTGGRLDIEAAMTDVDAAFAAYHPPLRPGPYVCLTVRDTGVGMAPDVMSRIFEPFFTTKEVGQGTGMGLAIVHGMVTKHGGAVTVESALGVGTMFAIYLPQLDASVATEPPADFSPTSAAGGRLLVVDDEVRIVRAMRDLLENYGYETVTATSGIEALERFRVDPYGFDCVITDQIMPRMTGVDLIRAMRQLRADIPVILCTGFSHVMDTMQSQALGLDALMMKPIDIAELVAVIQKLLARCSPPEG
jgi:CheY-like chemotaxis protein